MLPCFLSSFGFKDLKLRMIFLESAALLTDLCIKSITDLRCCDYTKYSDSVEIAAVKVAIAIRTRICNVATG